MSLNRSSELILRVGVAFAFLYAAIDGFLEPYSWIDYFPQFLSGILSAVTMLHLFAIIEIVIALWILSGWRIVIPSALAAVLLVAIVVFNFGEFQLLFRDLSIAAAALALVVDSYQIQKTKTPARVI